MSDDSEKSASARVLVVDDESDFMKLLNPSRRRPRKHTYVGRDSAESGLQYLREAEGANQVDVVIVDYDLGNEWSAIKFVQKARDIRPDVPYVIWSRYTESDMFDHIKQSTSIDLMFRTEVVGFINKDEALKDGARELESYVDTTLERFREQIKAHLTMGALGALREIEVVLTQVSSLRRGLDAACIEVANRRSKTTISLQPARLQAIQAELRLRRLLNYQNGAGPQSEEYLEGVREHLSGSASRALSLDLRRTLKAIALGEVAPKLVEKLESALANDLGLEFDTEEANQRVSEFISELCDLLVSAGQKERALTISTATWKIANRNWSRAPRIVCGMTHSWVLASSGNKGLAEQIAAALLHDAEDYMGQSHFAELSRTVFAEIDSRSADASRIPA